jgi:hypothetical protein
VTGPVTAADVVAPRRRLRMPRVARRLLARRRGMADWLSRAGESPGDPP